MPVFPRAETLEIFGGFGTGVLEKLHLDAARRRPSDSHIEKHNRISSRNRLFSKTNSNRLKGKNRESRRDVRFDEKQSKPVSLLQVSDDVPWQLLLYSPCKAPSCSGERG